MINHCKQTLILLTLLLMTNISFAAPMMALLDEENQSVNIGTVGSYYIDESARLSLRDIDSELLRKRFIPLKKDFQQFGLINGNIWIKVDIAQRLPSGQSAVLHIKAPRAQVVDVYTPNLLNNQIFAEMGDERPYQNRLIQYPDYIIPLPANVPPVYTAYIKISSRLPINLVIEIKTLSEMTKDVQKDNYITGFLIGILLLLFVSNVFFFLRTKHPMYLVYSALLVGIGCLHFALHGLIYQWFSESMGLQERLYNFSSLACAALITCFTRYYLDTRESLPRIDKLLLFLIVSNATLAIIFSISPQELNVAFLSASAVLTLITLLFVAIFSVFKRVPYSSYYLVARIVLSTGYLFWILAAYGILSTPFWYEWGLTTSIILEALVHFTGIITRHTPTNPNTSKQEGLQNFDVVSEVADLITTQTKVIDYQYASTEPKHEELKRAYKHLSNIATRINHLQNLKALREHSDLSSSNLQLLIDQATIDFYALDQNDSDIDIHYDATMRWELMNNAQTIKHVYQVIMEEMRHQTDQVLNIHSEVESKERDGLRTLHIKAYPIPSSVMLDNTQSFGPRYLLDLVNALGGQIELSGEGRRRSLHCKVPIHARQIELSDLARATQAETIIPVIIGHQDSELIERTSNFLHSRLLSLTHIDKLDDLQLLISNRAEKCQFIILLFEDQKNFGASDLVSFINNLHENDACLLISNNVNMSQEYANALGFNGFVYSSQIETKLLFDMERIHREISNSRMPRINR
ncbi:7TM diverse intracellular signaling domain-containing protein [Marinomonas ostreistagni]|uniref:Uncharacterized protein n=1 Tax=Marinomonas ostreistagni TaxID=359209 RepID=A0ABS0ZAG1_9GAMM|nr:7TM diverse intracellular signaling domain-containing protein [Marinomonas ostreistagni]MBJ7550659.1 hypothetical protein [Marinomonas ostreistagni]